MMRTCVVLLAMTLAAPAWGQGKEIVIGLFLPALPDASRAQRIKAVEDLASQIATKINQPVKGRSFARAADLNLAVKQRVVHFAIVDALFAADRRWTPMATLVSHGSKAVSWQFLAKTGATFGDLKGKTLAFASITGKADRQFVSNVLLEGEVAPTFFGWTASPDAGSAIRAVALGKAFATVVPAGRSTGGLTTVFVSPPVPTPVIVHVGRLPAKVQQPVLQAVLGWQGSWLGFDGWRAPEAGAYKRLASALAARIVRKPIVPKPQPFALHARDVFARFQPSSELPSVLGLMLAPKTRPDSF
jgi:hypothetical protein